MNKISLIILSFFIALSTVNAQKGINFSRNYATGGKMLMSIDSSVKNVFYANVFQNQPHTFFNFLPDVHNVSIQIYLRKTDNVKNYRYTILENDKPTVVNHSINEAELKEVDRGDEELFRTTSFGIFPIKDRTITIITYDIEKPQDVYTTIFYGKPIPKANITFLGKRFAVEKGVDYKYITLPKGKADLILNEKDDEVTIIKDKSDIDYIYGLSVKEKQTGKVVFNSTIWQYGGHTNEKRQFSPYITFDKSVFKKSGDYEVVIEPLIRWDNCLDCDISPKEIEEYIRRYTLSITLEDESYTKKEVLVYTLIVALCIGFVFLITIYFIKKRNKGRLAENEQQKNIAKLQLNSIRSQLNPHFLFNALSGIQNLMNKNEVDNANKYLTKFARLTRNVLDDKELISLSQEKTLLDDYLQMEQLRFGFTYNISHSKGLDLDNIEIPSMLLQPFVENAVKHGISQKANIGRIDIKLVKQANDLVLTVTDNGNGFDIVKRSPGLGLALSESRIKLLNSIYKENHFTLVIQSTTSGTIVNLTLTDWL